MDAYTKKGAVILGASFDTVEDNAAFARKFDFPYPLLCDTGRALGLAYGACDDAKAASARRISYVIGTDGRVREVHATVDVRTQPAELLTRM